MCETMASVPVEENSYVLTEDMFDAAMTEQFAYQDGIESEEDLSSQEEAMDIHDDPVVENTSNTSKTKVHQNISSSRVVMNPGTSDYNDSEMSVLVIETGLDKSKRVDVESVTTNTTSDVAVDKNVKKMSTSANSVVDCADKNLNSTSDATVTTVQNNDKVIDKTLPILKKILSDKPADSNTNLIESIDLCDSENDKFSDDDMSEVELTDDELKSVIKNNLMAEVGFTLNKQKESDSNIEKPTQVCSPKIAVKSIAQISTDAFNNFSNHNENSQIINKECVPPVQKINSETNNKTSVTANNTVSEISIRDKDQVPTTIQISKIAVPHHTFVNSKGQKMNCVYVRNQTALPVVINSNQPKNKNVRFMLTSQVKNGPVQLASLAALTNVTKLNVQNKPVLSKPTRVLSIAPKLEKPPILQSNPSRAIHQYTQVQCLDSIVKGLLFKKLKKPYVPLDTSTGVTYNCLECCDKFSLQSSLTHHLARRSVSIRYWCRICKTELEFYNRCVLLKHLRRHNTSLKHIDTTCITFNPIAKEMVDSGLASTSFEEFTNDQPNNSYILQRNSKNGQLQEIVSNTLGVDNFLNENQMVSTVSNLSSTSKKVTALAGQSKSVCIQTPSSIILNRPISALAPISQATKPMFTTLVPKTPKLSVMQNLKRPTMDQSPFLNKSGPKSVILLCNKLPKTAHPKQYSNKHINSISPNVGEPEFRKLEISLNDNKNNSVINNNEEEEEDIDIESVTIENDMSNTENSIIEKIGNEKSSINKTKDKKILPGSQKVKRNCSECGVACLNISKHLNGNNRPLNPDLACKVCHLILATKCALKIHLRIHMKMEPYKCPDCGKDFDSWEEVHAHLKFSCGHLAKCVRYLCVSCKAHFPSVGVLGHHISSIHSRCIFKCKLCPVAFFNSPSLDKHIQTSHPDEMDLRMDYRQCSMCPKKLVPMDKFVEHVQEHTKNNNVLIYGYKCPLCSVVFANKMAFIIHQLKEKKDKEQKEGKKPRSVKSMPTKNVSDSNSELEDEPEIIRKYPEINFNGSAAEKDPLSLEDWECSQEFTVKEKREELCIVCKKNSVVLLPNIDLNDQSLCCKQCVKPLDIDSAVNSNHLQLNNRNVTKTYVSNSQKNHIFNPIKRKRSAQKTIKRSASCDEVKMSHKKARTSVDNISKDYSPESESSMELFSDTAPVRKKSRKKTNKEKFGAAGQTHIQGQVITSKSPNELVCSKCEFVADTRETFLKHITTHRTDPNTFQCFECGLCFVVLPSLERHLQMHHGIKDVDSYTRKNSSSLPQKVVSLEEDVDDNQCRVCNEIFDSGSSLEKHFRTHGMAFMNSLSKSP
ncbi:zinc finger protein 532-like [Homalodisca vitripennis]|nr:zinc finger protein 532-like [Homalodisca vitripennis]XP_046662080.1 zinc finger protein 532-like [Homalodisca vitripennis]XP_046662081.1 zinc finger protein 532-like [Homalodisca vitripennis]